MKIKSIIKISLNSIKKHKVRSSLTILGIIVGIASIIATLAIGYGAEEKIKKEILASGDNYIFIHAGNWTQEGVVDSKKKKKAQPLRTTDIRSLKKQCPEIKKISPFIFSQDIVNFEGNNILTEVKGGNNEIFSIINRKIKAGSSFTKEQAKKGEKVVVLGSKAATDLFRSLSPIGQIVRIKNIPFRVIGILKEISFSGIQNPNLNIFIPFNALKKYIIHKRNNKVYGIIVSGKSSDEMQFLVRKIKKVLRFNRNLKEKDSDDFMIYDQKSMLKAAHASSNVLNIFLLIIALISLVVGGIGVMNIMFVSVSERTKEIGIRMALGATQKVILCQFILESIILCFIGGILGIFVGIIIPLITSFFTTWNVIFKPQFILFSFITTTMVGLIFGYYPAKKASKLNPVEALSEK
ncbi:MAG: ABC transporter permease [bacterium]